MPVMMDGGAEVTPWYDEPTLQAKNIYGMHAPVWDLPDPLVSEFVTVRVLPENTYVPSEYVVACVTAAIEWSKPVEVSWMEMEYQEHRGCEIPVQRHRKNAAVFYVDDDCMHFAVAGPEDMAEPVRVQSDCVTDIALRDLVPTNEPQDSAMTVEEHCEAGHAHAANACRRCMGRLRDLAIEVSQDLEDVDAVVDLVARVRGITGIALAKTPIGLQVDG